MALTAEDIRSLTGLAPELREVLAANAVEENNIKDGAVTAGKIAPGVIPEKYTLPAANTSTLGGVKQAAAVTDPESDEAAAVSTSLKALTASLRSAGILQA